jgi:hypothetical protein
MILLNMDLDPNNLLGLASNFFDSFTLCKAAFAIKITFSKKKGKENQS